MSTFSGTLMFSAEQEAVLRAAIDRIIPPDDQFPGGVEAGVFDFLLRHLASDGSEGFFAPFRAAYLAGLDALDELARSTQGVGFAELSAEWQDQTLIAFAEQNTAFFSRFVEHCQEGFYTSPTGFALVGWKVTG